GIPAVELHGNLSQGARERNLATFADGTTPVLVATDIAARGIHVDDITVVVTLMMPEQRGDVRALAKAAQITPTTTAVAPGHPLVEQLVGPSAPRRHV